MKTSQVTLRLRKRTPPQKRISQSKARFNIGIWSRQSGKTTYGLDKLIYKPLQGRPDGIYWDVLQTYSAAEIAFNRYWKLFDGCRDLLARKPNESEKFVELINGAKVFFKSGAVLEDLRAETLDGCIIDELRQQKPELWPRIISPMLSRRKGWCDFLSTANGFDHVYDLVEFAKRDVTGDWAVFHAPATECWWWTPDEIAHAKSIMSEAEFAQEILAEFRDLHSGSVYINFGDHNCRLDSPFTSLGLISPHLPIVVAMDFNVGHMAWTLGQHNTGAFYWFDEIFIKGTNTIEAAKELVEKVKDHPPGVILIGDASGKALKTSSVGKSDYDLLCQVLDEHRVKWRNLTPDSNPQIKDRINAVNAKLKAADGSVKMWLHPNNCQHLKKDFHRVSYKQGAQLALDQTTDPSLTHSSDGVGYAVHALSPIKDSVRPGTMKVLWR